MNRFKWQLVIALVLVAMVSVVSAVADRMSKTESFSVKKGGQLVVDVDNVSADIHVKVWNKGYRQRISKI
jgi:hypothetical protein